VQKTVFAAMENWEGPHSELRICPTEARIGRLAVALIRKFKGELGEEELQAFLRTIKAEERVSRGKDHIESSNRAAGRRRMPVQND
jgi:hypothetical protein